MSPDAPIKLAARNSDDEALPRCRVMMEELKRQQDAFLTIGGELSGEGPVWQFTWMSGGIREGVLGWLRRNLDRIDPDWSEFLIVD